MKKDKINMFAIIYIPTSVPVGLFVNVENALSRCKHLSESRDFGIYEVEVLIGKKVKIKEEGEE